MTRDTWSYSYTQQPLHLQRYDVIPSEDEFSWAKTSNDSREAYMNLAPALLTVGSLDHGEILFEYCFRWSKDLIQTFRINELI